MLLVACLCGYSARVLQEKLVPQTDGLPVEQGDIALANTFSEVEILKAAMDRLCTTFLLDLHRSSLATPPGDRTSVRAPDDSGDPSVRKLKQAIREFGGMDHEVRIAQALLTVHSRQRNDAEWLATYLRILYERPTHPFVGEYAREAVRRAGTAGEETLVAQALSHVLEIPFPLGSKGKVRGALEHLTRSD